MEHVAGQLSIYPDIRLVIIDVYQKIRAPSKKGISFYEKDYGDGEALQKFALEHNICILLLHHNSKKAYGDDPYNQMSGSTGLLESVDTAMVITKGKRFENTTKLSITGREIRPEELVMEFDDTSFRWKLQGTALEVERIKQMQEYKESPIIATIKKLVEQSDADPKEWRGSASDLISASKYLGATIYDDPRTVGSKLSGFEILLHIDGNIRFDYVRGRNKREYRFYKIE